MNWTSIDSQADLDSLDRRFTWSDARVAEYWATSWLAPGVPEDVSRSGHEHPNLYLLVDIGVYPKRYIELVLIDCDSVGPNAFSNFHLHGNVDSLKRVEVTSHNGARLVRCSRLAFREVQRPRLDATPSWARSAAHEANLPAGITGPDGPTSSRASEDSVPAFILLVEQFLDLVDRIEERLPYQFLSECGRILPKLYAASLDLPDVEPEDSDPNDQVCEDPQPGVTKLLGRYDLYAALLDPYIYDKPSVASLAGDLAEIYVDLKRAYLDYLKGEVADAVWEWRFTFSNHAGHHLVSAMTAIHWVVHSHMAREYSAKQETDGQQLLGLNWRLEEPPEET